ncbi:MAG TPA: PDZ domain-containing protein [Chitinophagaceae bacterium]|nr:PDZ domain-containing protein [Chitinophagaceae bacterium]
MYSRNIYLLLATILPFACIAQNPFTHWTDAVEIRHSNLQPIIHYLLTVDSSDPASVRMEMRIRNIPDTFNVAMVAHPEYDDKYWRYVEDLYVETGSGRGRVTRKDSALWQVLTRGREAILHYRVRLPVVAQRSAWKAFLTPAGGLVGGPHCFLYVLGETLTPSHITLRIPGEWQIATGLIPTADPATYFASTVNMLVDDPIMIGKLKRWNFGVDGVPHHVVYWPWPVENLDADKLVSGIRKLVEQAVLVFGRLPYREYFFMFQDSAYGALEHINSITVGAPVSELNSNISGLFSEIAHEYFHSWNLVRIHPVEYGDVSYQTPPLSKGLWFSEGLTIFYADLLKRRAGLPVFDSTRINHLEGLIRRYLANPAYLQHTAEKISLAAYGPPGMLGDYSASTHLQGELIGALLDIIIRDASNGTRSMDDLMRKMMERFSGRKGFVSRDIARVASEVCGCNLEPFFRDHIVGTKAFDFNKWLRLLGLEMTMVWKEARTAEGKLIPDLRAYSWQETPGSPVRIGITNPGSCWGKAGLHTGDILKKVNGLVISETADFRQLIRAAQPGDTFDLEVLRSSGSWRTKVLVTGFQQPEVRLNRIAMAPGKQRKLLAQWEAGQ